MTALPAWIKRPLSLTKRLALHGLVALAARLHGLGVSLIVLARRLVRFTEPQNIDAESDRFVMQLPGLQRKIGLELARQRKEYTSYAYFHGYPYQALAILNVFGERGTEERFDAYGLADLIARTDRVLDIGCNCGFMAVYAAFRTGCQADGIDINPHMIRIGQHCAEFLRLGERVRLMAEPFQDFRPERPYTVVLSFATHWTDDRNYRVRLQDHLRRVHGMMAAGGLLIFESHAADVGNPEFYAALEEMRGHFALDGRRMMANGTRELYLMRHVAAA
jgi:SAM-dependent methyltransferase